MAINERGHHIKALENLLSHYKAREKCEGYYDSTLKDSVEALHYAISSLKTDEAYQLMYEGEDVYTKDEVKAMLKELKEEIEEMKMQSLTEKEIWNNAIGVCSNLIQQKIDKLKEVEL